MMDFLFGTAPGVVTDPDQQRAMSQEEQIQHLQKMAMKAIMEGKVTDLPLCGDSRRTIIDEALK